MIILIIEEVAQQILHSQMEERETLEEFQGLVLVIQMAPEEPRC